jgi:hypothetical protein
VKRRLAMLFVLVVAATLAAACSPIPRPGNWHLLGAIAGMTGVEATIPLPDGRVVVMGSGKTAIFDPSRERWSQAAPMPPIGGGEAATLLGDGTILVTGGSPPSGIPGIPTLLSTAYLYLPLSDKWVPTASMLVGRELHTATLLDDGRVLVAGGLSDQGVIGSCEIYDPRTKQWSQAASMALAHVGHTATLLPDGRVLVTGGSSAAEGPFGAPFQPSFRDYEPEIFDPGSDRWTTSSFAVPVADPLVVRLPDGGVVATGGMSGFAPSHVTQELDPRTGRWVLKASNPGGLGGPFGSGQGVLLDDGRVLLVSGQPRTYDPAADRWAPATLPPPGIDTTSAATLPLGRVLVVGFVSNFVSQTGPPPTTSAIFDPSGYPPLPGSSGPLASSTLLLILAGIAAVMLVLVGVRALVTRA